MSNHFSANQYDGSFKSVKLQNWQVPMSHKERPDTQVGFTEIIANNRGHLLADALRSKKSPWDTGYVNAWSMPRKIPGNCISVKTARSTYAQEKLQCDYQEAMKGRKTQKNKTLGSAGQAPPIEASPAPPVEDGDAKMIRTPTPQERKTPVRTPTPQTPVPAPSPCPVHGDRTARSPLATPEPSAGRRTVTPQSPDKFVAM